MLEVFHLLADGKVHTGTEIGKKLGITRAAVWKKIQKIQVELNQEVICLKGKGYSLPAPVIPLDKNKVYAWLNEPIQIKVCQQIESTNHYARSLAKTTPNPLLVVAEGQSSGLGRRGRSWYSPYAKNLYFSLIWPLDAGLRQIEGLSLVVGLAVYRAISAYEIPRLGLKWPNDLIIQNKKLGGVLIELVGDPADKCSAIIGIGVNVNMETKNLESHISQPCISIFDVMQQHIDRNKLLAQIINEMVRILAEHQANGFGVFKAEWERAHLWQGSKVYVDTGDYKVSGIAQGVNSRGEIIINTDSGQKCFTGGEVSLRLDYDT